MKSPVLRQFLSYCVTVLTPVVVVLTAIRLLMNPLFLQVEYNMPGFPRDPYGFTTEDRLYWANNALEYLKNDAGIEFLGDLRFEDGTPVYNQRELGHMVDVKLALGAAMSVWIVSLVLLLALGGWAWLGGWAVAYRQGLARGGWLTVFLLAAILIFVLFGFGIFFVLFHEVFFDPGTWMFDYRDTLIRLFPERFWQDIFMYVGGFSILVGLALALGLRGRKVSSRTEATQL